ncbi:MAG: PAS domain-containing protein, partial [Cytophagales bacterium]|nr:PAS domain-containing protein [Cytophagales bacterium]
YNGVVVCDHSFRIQYANGYAEQTLGYRPGELEGQRMTGILDMKADEILEKLKTTRNISSMK